MFSTDTGARRSSPKRVILEESTLCAMPWSKKDMDLQLSRQSLWLKESWSWLLNERILKNRTRAGRPKALDVGCGPGFVMEELSPLFDVQGIDIDSDAVADGRRRGLTIQEGDAHRLPFEDDAFDVVYCSFLMLWVRDPVAVVSEMARVSNDWVACLAEPDIGARIDYPEQLSALGRIVEEGMRGEGGDPLIGRKLRWIFKSCGLDAEIGVHPGVWGIERMREESEEEWRYIALTASDDGRRTEISRLKPIWDRALEDGSMFQFNPTFYAFSRKHSHR